MSGTEIILLVVFFVGFNYSVVNETVEYLNSDRHDDYSVMNRIYVFVQVVMIGISLQVFAEENIQYISAFYVFTLMGIYVKNDGFVYISKLIIHIYCFVSFLIVI